MIRRRGEGGVTHGGQKRDALVASAEKALQKGKVDSALKDYLKVLEETPGDINILNKVGDLYTRLNRNEEAIPYFTRIAEHFARDGFFLRGIAIYKRINRLDPSRLDVYERLAELYAKQGLTTDAKSQYQVLADYHARNDNAIGAIGIYQKMVQIDPQNIQLHVKLADFYTQARRKVDALKEYAVVAALLRDRGAIDEAIQVYEKALQMAPDNVEVLRSFVPLLARRPRRVKDARSVRASAPSRRRRAPCRSSSSRPRPRSQDARRHGRAGVAREGAGDRGVERRGPAARGARPAGRRHATLTFEAAAALADQAMRRGEAKKALGILAAARGVVARPRGRARAGRPGRGGGRRPGRRHPLAVGARRPPQDPEPDRRRGRGPAHPPASSCRTPRSSGRGSRSWTRRPRGPTRIGPGRGAVRRCR